MQRLRILEWNINQRSSERKIPGYVPSEILVKHPDVIVLVEFKGQDNARYLTEQFSNYYVCYYNGLANNVTTTVTTATGEQKQRHPRSNGILIALSKEKFTRPSAADMTYQNQGTAIFDEQQPNWLKVHCHLLAQDLTLDIIGIRVQVGKESKQDLQSRQEQLRWLLDKQQTFDRQIVIGDLNYGPHRTADSHHMRGSTGAKPSWQDIIQVMRDATYLDLPSENLPYSPTGTSWKSEQLDWLITKGVTVNRQSSYNALDWQFGRHNTMCYVDGYLVLDGLFIASKPGYPDHAIFTVEINL